jgi:hypothetical protein
MHFRRKDSYIKVIKGKIIPAAVLEKRYQRTLCIRLAKFQKWLDDKLNSCLLQCFSSEAKRKEESIRQTDTNKQVSAEQQFSFVDEAFMPRLGCICTYDNDVDTFKNVCGDLKTYINEILHIDILNSLSNSEILEIEIDCPICSYNAIEIDINNQFKSNRRTLESSIKVSALSNKYATQMIVNKRIVDKLKIANSGSNKVNLFHAKNSNKKFSRYFSFDNFYDRREQSKVTFASIFGDSSNFLKEHDELSCSSIAYCGLDQLLNSQKINDQVHTASMKHTFEDENVIITSL